MILLILESHGPLHFRASINERSQLIAGKRMVISARVDVLKSAGLGIMLLSVDSGEQESFDLIRGIQRVAFPLVQFIAVGLQNSSNIGAKRAAILVNHFAKHHYLAGAEIIGRSPVERAPINSQSQVAFSLRGESADRRAIKRQIVPTLDQKLLVIVEHVQPAFEVAEQYGNCLDTL